MAKKRSLIIALTLSVIAVAAVVCVIWLVPGRSGTTSGVSAAGISVMAGGISWLGLSVIGGGCLSIVFVLAACVVLLVSADETVLSSKR